MARHEEGGAEGLQVLLLLPEPLDLLGQQEDKGDLHHLRRADLEGDAGEFQPGPVAGVARHAQGRFQQENEAHIKGQNPLPLPGDGLQVQHGEEDIDADPKSQGRALDDHPPQALVGGHVPGGAVHQRDAIQRGGDAQTQQHQIGLLDEVRQDCFQSVQHDTLLGVQACTGTRYFTTNKKTCKPSKFVFTHCSNCVILN